MKNLCLNMYGTTERASQTMKRLGITYQCATPQSISDCWWFWNCENVPDELPPNLTLLKMGIRNKWLKA